MEGLHESGVSDDKIQALQIGLDEKSFSPRELALLRLAEELTLYPATSAGAVPAALEAGWSAAEVASAIFIVSYYNLVTRIVDAFALPPDQGHPYDPDSPIPMFDCQEE